MNNKKKVYLVSPWRSSTILRASTTFLTGISLCSLLLTYYVPTNVTMICLSVSITLYMGFSLVKQVAESVVKFLLLPIMIPFVIFAIFHALLQEMNEKQHKTSPKLSDYLIATLFTVVPICLFSALSYTLYNLFNYIVTAVSIYSGHSHLLSLFPNAYLFSMLAYRLYSICMSYHSLPHAGLVDHSGITYRYTLDGVKEFPSSSSADQPKVQDVLEGGIAAKPSTMYFLNTPLVV